MSNIKNFQKKYINKIDALDLEILIAFIIKKPRSFILSHPEYKLTKRQSKKLTDLIKRRLNNEPIAYLTGQKEFYGFNFKVNKNTLVPRPETELMVDEILKQNFGQTGQVIFIDVGTGSGCIIITLAKLMPKNSNFLAIDISRPALAVARQNAKLNHVEKKIKFFYGNLLEPIIKNLNNLKYLKNPKNHIVITANLPYLTPAQVKKSLSIEHEPKLALTAGPDGLKYYRKLFKQLKTLSKLTPNSRLSVLCEINPSQTAKIKQLIKKNLPQIRIHLAKSFNKVEIKKDLRGLNRLVIIKCYNPLKE